MCTNAEREKIRAYVIERDATGTNAATCKQVKRQRLEQIILQLLWRDFGKRRGVAAHGMKRGQTKGRADF